MTQGDTKGNGPKAGSAPPKPPPPASKPMSKIGVQGGIPPVGSGPPKSKVGF